MSTDVLRPLDLVDSCSYPISKRVRVGGGARLFGTLFRGKGSSGMLRAKFGPQALVPRCTDQQYRTRGYFLWWLGLAAELYEDRPDVEAILGCEAVMGRLRLPLFWCVFLYKRLQSGYGW